MKTLVKSGIVLRARVRMFVKMVSSWWFKVVADLGILCTLPSAVRLLIVL